jgi:saccharopine dehydrogenase-like NADP-dependent oxidoreductase
VIVNVKMATANLPKIGLDYSTSSCEMNILESSGVFSIQTDGSAEAVVCD